LLGAGLPRPAAPGSKARDAANDAAPRVSLSRVNSGATFFMSPAPRGTDTFRRIADHPERDPIVEFAVDYSEPSVADLVLSVSRWHGAGRLETFWRRDR
jgi:hypothetical protein